MKNIYDTLAVVVSMLALSACSSDEATSVTPPDAQAKTAIELEASIAGTNSAAQTSRQMRTVVTTDNNRADAFNPGTNLFILMKSDEKDGTGVKCSRTMGVAAAKEGENKFNAVGFTGNYIRYWEDAHGRKSQLSLFAACVIGRNDVLPVGGGSDYTTNTWSTGTVTPTIAWPLDNGTVTSQTSDFLTQQDLCFSNNVSNVVSDNRVKFDAATNKFDRNKKMVFYHALTKITFKIKKGSGFESASFAFTDANKNIELVGFNTKGTLNMEQGEFQDIQTDAINKFAESTETDFNYVLTAMLLPGTDLNGTDKDALDKINFTIDNNQYHITKAQLKKALDGKTLSDNTTAALENTGNAYRMRPGVHYIFELTVGKTQISQLSAAVAEWETVNAIVQPSNARVTVSLLDANTNEPPSPVALYRSIVTSGDIATNDFSNYDWATNYKIDGNKVTLTHSGSHYNLSTNWDWPDNKTFYHLRAVYPEGSTVTAATNDYLSLTGAGSYTDVQWGAPFKSTNGKLAYSLTDGFDNASGSNHQIYKAIGATTETIKLVMFHMMSDVKIVLQTTDGADKVTLSGATLSFSNISPTGTVRMGDGLVTATGTAGSVNGTVDDANYPWHYGFVPQDLTNVKLTITTADHNQYIINMKDVVASSISSTLLVNPYNDNKITRWYPNYKYTYTFNLKKTGVDKVTVTLAAWEDVTANDNVQIK